MTSGPISSDRFPLLGLQNHCGRRLQPWNQKTMASWQESDDKPRQGVEKQRHYSANQVHTVKATVFPMVKNGCWELDHKEGSSGAQLCPTLCDPMDCSNPGFPVYHQLLELAQFHVHQVGDAIQPSHPLSSPSPAFSLSQHQGLFQWVSSSHQVAKVLEF